MIITNKLKLFSNIENMYRELIYIDQSINIKSINFYLY